MYKSNNELSTKNIEEKIKQINAADVVVKEEKRLESLVVEEIEREIDELTDIAAAEIVAEEIAEDIFEEMALANFEDINLGELEMDSLDFSDEQVEKSESNSIADTDNTDEGSGNLPSIDFGDIMEVILGN